MMETNNLQEKVADVVKRTSLDNFVNNNKTPASQGAEKKEEKKEKKILSTEERIKKIKEDANKKVKALKEKERKKKEKFFAKYYTLSQAFLKEQNLLEMFYQKHPDAKF